MTPRAPQAPQTSFATWRMLAAVGLVALATAGCLKRAAPDVTGSLPGSRQVSPEDWRKQAETLAPRFEANPGDPATALQYARALRGSEQGAQAVAVLQQAALRTPNNPELLAAYGKALADVGRFKEASQVLGRAHSPERPDWRILSAQGVVADHTGDNAAAQNYYEAALKLVPNEPTVLANLGLSYALSKRLEDAEQTLRLAADQPSADARVRQNLALVLSLRGKFDEAESLLKSDVSPEEATAIMADLRGMSKAAGSRRAEAGPAKAKRS